jgi:thiosulfate reductase cytochrome b subunit
MAFFGKSEIFYSKQLYAFNSGTIFVALIIAFFFGLKYTQTKGWFNTHSPFMYLIHLNWVLYLDDASLSEQMRIR